MRRFVVALVIALVALTLVGCGGGGGTATTTTPSTGTGAAAAPAAAAPVAPALPAYVGNRSVSENGTPTAFPSFVDTATPAVFKQKLDAHRAMAIVFYDDGQDITNTMRAEVTAAMTNYRGLVDLITFTVNGPKDNPKIQQAVTYAAELKAQGTPYIVVVDRGGFITYRNKGYVDRAIIARELERASR